MTGTKSATVRAVCVLLALAPFGAVSAGPVPQLDLVTAYENALARNNQIRQGEQQVEASREGVNKAYSAVKPQIEATASYGTSDYQRNINSPLGGRTTEEDRETHRRFDITMGQVIYSQKAFSGITEAQAELKSTKKQKYSKTTDVQLSVIQHYLAVLRSERQLEVAQEELASHRKRLERIEGLRERGFATRGDKLEAQAQIDQARTRVVRLRNEAQTARNRLTQFSATRFERLDPVNTDLWRRTPELLARRDWEEQVLKHAASIEKRRADVELREAQRDRARAEHYPELHLRARYTDNDTWATNLRREARLALELSVPIYSGGRVSASRRASNNELRAAEYALAHQRERLKVDLSNILQNLDGSHASIQSLRASMESASAALEEAESGFEAGVRDLTDVLDARNRLSDVKQKLAAKTYENLFHQFELLVISGNLEQQDLAVLMAASG